MIQSMSTNRKQRRLQDKKAGKGKPPVNKKMQENAARAAELKAQGMALKNAGKEAEAVPLLKEALQLDSSLADVHFALAMMARAKPDLRLDIEEINRSVKDKKTLINSYFAIMIVLRQKRHYKEACICQEEICRLKPDDTLALMDLGLLLNISGRSEEAIVQMSKALNANPEDKIVKGVFSTSLQGCAFTAFHPEVKKAMTECFKNVYDVHLRQFWFAWINLMIKDPSYPAFKKALAIGDPIEFKKWADALDEQSGAFLHDPFFIGGLRLLVIADGLTEGLLTRLRRYLCLNFDDLRNNGRISLFTPFIYALAQQCFFNEYVYYQDNDEQAAADSLAKRGEPVAIGMASCYSPLYKTCTDKGKLLHELATQDSEFSHLVKAQFHDPLEEKRIKSDIPLFGKFANEISLKVQDQYEENPYPRWTTICSIPLPNDDMLFDARSRDLPFKILVAGCGTGRHAIGTAIRYPNSKVTAIDLSRASLAYGLRKARECGVAERIDFVNADILSMKDWAEDFDIIECSGVLHHMEDPFLGWQTLNAKLKPNGLFKIGLYSEIARQPIVQAREFIAQNNYPATIEGIRACRRALFALPTKNPVREFVTTSGDFYTTSATRDLIFHVQEHRLTLPQISEMTQKLGLQCVRFTISSPDSVYNYDKMFPDDPNRASFANWEKFEKKYPLTFAGMYQFWCQKTV